MYTFKLEIVRQMVAHKVNDSRNLITIVVT